MAAYPPKVTLPYLVGASWLEEQTLAGRIVESAHESTIELAQLDDELRERATALYLDVDARRHHRTGTVDVLSSGIEAQGATRSDGATIRMEEPILRKISRLPTLPAPVENAAALIAAYEAWCSRYRELAPEALAAWLEAWKTDEPIDDDGEYPNGAPGDAFETPMFLRIGDTESWTPVDGREVDIRTFQRTRAASALYHYAASLTKAEDAWTFALGVVGRGAPLPRWLPPEEAITRYEAYAHRIAHVAFSRAWTLQLARGSFEEEMQRWAGEHGSKRLRIGLADGYRMVPVYLNDRIAREVPGFYAHLAKPGDDIAWQPRTGPTEEALRLRRAVQERLERFRVPGSQASTTEIGWMKNPPLALLDERFAYETDENGYPEDGIKDCAFEIIGVRGWLDRYTLVAAVFTAEEDQPPDFVQLKHVLQPGDYGLEDMPFPPGGVSIADNSSRGFWPRSDIPADMGDFVPAPAPPGTKAPTADDDIPF